jgi:hypothetical protein
VDGAGAGAALIIIICLVGHAVVVNVYVTIGRVMMMMLPCADRNSDVVNVMNKRRGHRSTEHSAGNQKA